MIDKITETLSTKYFPTSQFEHDFSNEEFKELKNLFVEAVGEIELNLPAGRYAVDSYLGQGLIAGVPWIGIHSTKPDFDATPRNGFYLTILWRYDGSGVCLSFQKGTDGIQGGKKAQKIKTAVDLIRDKYGTAGFETSINLAHKKGRPRAYQQAHITGREYDKGNLTDLPKDLLQIENLYNNVVNHNPMILLDDEGDSGRVIGKELFDPTFDRETLEERADDLLSIDERKPAQGNPNPGQRTVETTQHERDPGVRADVLDRASGKCELCDKDAPFLKANGKPFLEVHHAIPLGEGGPDTVENAFALCPNCHREAHYGANKESFRQMLENGQRKPKRKHGGPGQIIAEAFGHKFE
jgi:hypothetical protein